MVLFGFLAFTRLHDGQKLRVGEEPMNSGVFNCRLQLIILGIIGLVTGTVGELVNDDEDDIGEQMCNMLHVILTMSGLLFSFCCAVMNFNYLVLKLANTENSNPLIALTSTITTIYVSCFLAHSLSLSIPLRNGEEENGDVHMEQDYVGTGKMELV